MNAAIMFLLVGGVLWLASKAYAEDTPEAGAARDPRGGPAVCDLTAGEVATRNGRAIRQWLNCPGRLNSDVETLTRTLTQAGDAITAAAVLDRWTARRNIDTASPDGTLAPAARRTVDAAMRATEPELRGPTYAPAPLAGVERDAQGSRLAPPRESRARIQTVESVSPAIAAYDPNLARRLAGPLSRHITSRGENYDRERVRVFQRAAGFHPNNQTGFFDCKTHNAMRHYGIASPPSPIHGVTTNCSMHPYVPPQRGTRTVRPLPGE